CREDRDRNAQDDARRAGDLCAEKLPGDGKRDDDRQQQTQNEQAGLPERIDIVGECLEVPSAVIATAIREALAEPETADGAVSVDFILHGRHFTAPRSSFQKCSGACIVVSRHVSYNLLAFAKGVLVKTPQECR